MERVSIQLAFGFECPYCHWRNYVDAVPVELSEEERAEAIERGVLEIVDSLASGELEGSPETATCSNCDREMLLGKRAFGPPASS